MVRPLHLFLLLFCQLLWGVNFAIVRIALQVFEPVTFIAMRFSLVALALLPIVGLPSRKYLRRLLPLSITMGSMHFSLISIGMKQIEAGTASIAVQLQVPFAAILAHYFLGEKLGWRRVLGMAIAFAGVVMIAGEPRLSGSHTGLAAVIAASLCWALANVQIKALGWIAMLAAPQLAVIAFLMEGDTWSSVPDAPWEGWAAMAYQAIVVAIFSYWIWYAMMRRYPVNVVMPFTLLVPLIAVAAGSLMLGETITWQMLVGGIATMAGVAIIVIRRPGVVAPSTKTGI
jgi:O-acetylserine/cysteine efflux transporter